MKRNTVLLVLIAVAICLLIRSESGLPEDTTVRIAEETPPLAIETQQIPEPSDRPQGGTDASYHVSSDEMDPSIIIPDPAETEETVTVRIPSRYIYADLGFLGFKNDVYIAAYTSDKGTGTASYEMVNLNGGDKASKVILVIYALKDEESGITDISYTRTEDIQGYMAVLDYISHTSYLIKIDIPPSFVAVQYVASPYRGPTAANCVIVYRDHYKYRDTAIYRHFPEEDEYRLAYSNYLYSDDGGYADFDDHYFSGYLTDDYKVVVECELLNFSKTFSLLDRGLTKEDLEMKYAIKDDEDEPEDYYITRSFRFYDNGKWTGDREHVPMVVYRAEFDDCRDPNYLKFMYSFNIHKYFGLGNAIVYFRYNPETQQYEPAKASFEIEVF